MSHQYETRFYLLVVPLPLAIAFPLLGLTRDLHPLMIAHVERTKKAANRQTIDCYFALSKEEMSMVDRVIQGIIRNLPRQGVRL